MEESTVTALLRTQGWEDASIRIDSESGRASVLATLGGERWLLRITEARCMDGVVRQFLTRLEQVYRGGSPPIPRGSGRHGLPSRIHFDDSYLYQGYDVVYSGGTPQEMQEMNADNNGNKNKTETYLVVVWIAYRRYLTMVEASSASSAEHAVLDLARDGYYHKNVDSCQAFDRKGIKTDFFYEAMRFAEPIPFEELTAIVLRRRTLIEAWDKLVDLEREAERLQKEKETATAMLMGEA